jgi:hypothetical protein
MQHQYVKSWREEDRSGRKSRLSIAERKVKNQARGHRYAGFSKYCIVAKLQQIGRRKVDLQRFKSRVLNAERLSAPSGVNYRAEDSVDRSSFD